MTTKPGCHDSGDSGVIIRVPYDDGDVVHMKHVTHAESEYKPGYVKDGKIYRNEECTGIPFHDKYWWIRSKESSNKMKTFGDTVDYREWVEQIAGNVEQIGSIRSAAQIAVSEVYNYCDNEFIILTNGRPAVEERAPPAEILRHTFDNPPYRKGQFEGSGDWREIAVMCLIRDIKNARSK